MKPIIVANWKCNPDTEKEAGELFGQIEKGIRGLENKEVVIVPPFIYLPSLNNKSGNIKLGAQDCFWEEKGPFTGEISPIQLVNLGCEYVILGHSERRISLKETVEMVNKKIKSALKVGLKVILCVGGDFNKNNKISKNNFKKSSYWCNGKCQNLKEIGLQLKKKIKGLKDINFSNLLIAYEPVGAVSTSPGGKPLQPEEVKVGAIFIQNILGRIFGREKAKKIRILYGGSINSENAKDFIIKSQVSGFLVGGASLKAEEFIELVKSLEDF